MNRSDFLKIIGAGALVGVVGLPSVQAVDALMKERSGIKPEEDPFSVIRKLMKEAAKPDWEYHFLTTRYNYREYHVFLFQNENTHRESVAFKDDHPLGFNERAQTDLFKRLMYSVDQFNALPVENQQSIKDLMKTIR